MKSLYEGYFLLWLGLWLMVLISSLTVVYLSSVQVSEVEKLIIDLI